MGSVKLSLIWFRFEFNCFLICTRDPTLAGDGRTCCPLTLSTHLLLNCLSAFRWLAMIYNYLEGLHLYNFWEDWITGVLSIAVLSKFWAIEIYQIINSKLCLDYYIFKYALYWEISHNPLFIFSFIHNSILFLYFFWKSVYLFQLISFEILPLCQLIFYRNYFHK